jgi:pimeloyl-ACP methyl ester carboxylesterase
MTRQDIVLAMVPGMGMQAGDFDTQGLNGAVAERGWPVAIATVDPGPDAYLDGSVETRLLDGIADARRATGATRVWLAGISLGCQGILRCVRVRPDLAEGLILLTPYLGSTGLIAEIVRTGGLRRWSIANAGRPEPERALLCWLATTPLTGLLPIFVGRALGDRFAATATMLEELLHPDQISSVPGAHDWASWRLLWGLILDQNPLARQPAAVP